MTDHIENENNKIAAGSLKNKKRELFCRFYANECWGRPEEALVKAGYRVRTGEIVAMARAMLESADVRERVRRLREIRSDNSIADDVWIKESLIKIAAGAERDCDRIRAIASLCKVMGLTGKKTSVAVTNNNIMEQTLLAFEGPEDGSA